MRLGLVFALLGLVSPLGVASAQEQPTVALTPSAAYGSVLTDPSGWTLYTWDGDQEGVSNCYDACSIVWPPYTVDSSVSAGSDVPGTLGLMDRGDGTWQVTFENWPMYYFSGDAQPGDVNGEGSTGFGARWYINSYGAPAEVAAPQRPAPPPPPVVAQPQMPPVQQPAAAPPQIPSGLSAIPDNAAGRGPVQSLPPSYGPAPQYGFNPEGNMLGMPFPQFGGQPFPPPPFSGGYGPNSYGYGGGGYIPGYAGGGYSPIVSLPAPPNGSVTLTWIANPMAQVYRIYQTTSAQPFNFSVQQTINQSPGSIVSNATVNGLTPGVVYLFEVRAVDLSGGEMLTPALATAPQTIGPIALLPPSGVTVTGSTTTSATLSWAPIPGVPTYRIWQASSPTGPFSAAAIGNVNSTNATITGLAPNVTYYFQVSAVDTAGHQSPPSGTVAATTTSPLVAPANVSVAAVTPSSATLMWSIVPGAASYQVYQSQGAGGPFAIAATAGSATNSFTINGLAPSTPYFFQVASLDSLGNASPASGTAMGITAAAVPPPAPPVVAPSAPTGVSATAVSSSSISLTWNASAGASSYNVLQSSNGAGPFFAVGTGLTGTGMMVTVLNPSATYYFQVSATDSLGNASAASNVASAATSAVIPPVVPPPPTPVVNPAPPPVVIAPPATTVPLVAPYLSASGATATSVNLSWGTVPGATSYVVTQKRIGAFPATIAANTSATSTTITGLQFGASYSFEVAAIDGSGTQGPSSQPVVVTAR